MLGQGAGSPLHSRATLYLILYTWYLILHRGAAICTLGRLYTWYLLINTRLRRAFWVHVRTLNVILQTWCQVEALLSAQTVHLDTWYLILDALYQGQGAATLCMLGQLNILYSLLTTYHCYYFVTITKFEEMLSACASNFVHYTWYFILGRGAALCVRVRWLCTLYLILYTKSRRCSLHAKPTLFLILDTRSGRSSLRARLT